LYTAVLREYIAFAMAEHGDTSLARELFYQSFGSSGEESTAYSSCRSRTNLSYYLAKTGFTTAALTEANIAAVLYGYIC
jgi:hypothetical protein